MKKIYIIFFILLCLTITILFINEKHNNKGNVIKNITFNQIEDNNTPLNYKKIYTFTITKLNNKNNSLNFNIENHYVEVFIDNKKVYNKKIKKNNRVSIPLNKKHINKKVKIVLIPLDENNINNNLDLNIK